MATTKYTKEFLLPYVQESKSVSEVIRKLGLKLSGGMHSHISKVIKKLDIDDSHFTGQGHNKVKKFPPKRPIEAYLNNEVSITSHSLKKRLIKEGIFQEECSSCGLREWMGELIPLELHHKDCDHTNNNLDNLEILCSNCHSLTHRIIQKQKKESSKSPSKSPKKSRTPKKQNKNFTCGQCGKPSTHKHFCSQKCSQLSRRKVDRPSREELLKELETSSYLALGRKYKVSDNAIRKWLK